MYVAATDANRGRSRDRHLVEPGRTRLTVELESQSEPIRGRISEPGGRAREFSGYMGLIEALERLRTSGELESAVGDWHTGLRTGGST
jgi:hypothetical protein